MSLSFLFDLESSLTAIQPMCPNLAESMTLHFDLAFDLLGIMEYFY